MLCAPADWIPSTKLSTTFPVKSTTSNLTSLAFSKE